MYNEAFQILLLEILFHYTQNRNALITMGDLVEGQIIKDRQYKILKETNRL